MSGILFFDGRCGICTRAVYAVKRLDRTGDMDIAPFQRAGTAARLGIPESRMVESAWWLDSSGVVFGGAEAMNAALSVALGTRLPLMIYRVPGIRGTQEAVYRWIATHRYRFRGTTPYCEAHPLACGR